MLGVFQPNKFKMAKLSIQAAFEAMVRVGNSIYLDAYQDIVPTTEIERSFTEWRVDNHLEIIINGNGNKIYLTKGG
jgi:hypothetical protein